VFVAWRSREVPQRRLIRIERAPSGPPCRGVSTSSAGDELPVQIACTRAFVFSGSSRSCAMTLRMRIRIPFEVSCSDTTATRQRDGIELTRVRINHQVGMFAAYIRCKRKKNTHTQKYTGNLQFYRSRCRSPRKISAWSDKFTPDSRTAAGTARLYSSIFGHCNSNGFYFP
jgi:hypothetical protein